MMLPDGENNYLIPLSEGRQMWGSEEKQNWFGLQKRQRSYRDDVITKIRQIRSTHDVIQYGALSIDPDAYPVYLIRSRDSDPQKKTVLITGGVHGYETSGVHGALAFMKSVEALYTNKFNFVCAPCISPWAYETVNRWNPKAIDPNRSFYQNSPAEESQLLINALSDEQVRPFVHFDLHETTDTDNTVFRPALEKRDGVTHEFSEIPDGFYVVGDTEKPRKEFQKAVIDAVRKVTHIAPADANGKLIGVPLEQEGVINYPLKKLFLCAGLTDAEYTTTTEVYPDSPKATAAICIDAQIAAIKGGLEFLLIKAIPL